MLGCVVLWVFVFIPSVCHVCVVDDFPRISSHNRMKMQKYMENFSCFYYFSSFPLVPLIPHFSLVGLGKTKNNICLISILFISTLRVWNVVNE